MPDTINELIEKLAAQNIEVQELKKKNIQLKTEVEDLENTEVALEEQIEELKNMDHGQNLIEKQKNEACDWLIENCSVEEICQMANLTADIQQKPYPYPGYVGEGIYLPGPWKSLS